MKTRLILSVWALFTGCFLQAQSYTINYNYGNNLYKDVQNHMVVTVDGYEPEFVLVFLDGVQLVGYKGRYSPYAPDYPVGTEVKLKVSVIKNGEIIPLANRTFYVHLKSTLFLQVGTYRNRDDVNRSVFVEAARITSLDTAWTIQSFYCALVPKGSEASFYENNGADFSQTLKQHISSVGPGTKIIFDEIYLINAVGERKKASPLIFTVP